MRTLLLSIVSLHAFITVHAQSHRFADTTAQWNVLHHEYGWFPTTPETYITTEMKVMRDTVINGNVYQSVNGNYFIRQDSLRKVYLLHDGLEVKIYDFGATKGDTVADISRAYNYPIVYCVVDSVDTVNWLKPRKRLFASCYTEQSSIWYADEWVDGIGTVRYNSVSNYVYAAMVDRPEETLLCFFENGQVAYHNTNFDTCNYRLNVGIEEIDRLSASFSPNPSSSYIILALSKQPQPNTAILIHDAFGRIMKREELIATTQQISIAGLPNGIYTYAITQNNQWQASGKLVVSH